MDEYKEESSQQEKEELEQIVSQEQEEKRKRKKRKKRITILLCLTLLLLIAAGTLGILVYKYSVVDQSVNKGFWAMFDFTEGDNQLHEPLDDMAHTLIREFFTEPDGLKAVDPAVMPLVYEYFGVEGEEELEQFREKFFVGCRLQSDYAFWLDYEEVVNQFLEEATGNEHNVKEAYRDGIKIDITVIPASGKKTFEVYKTPRGKSQYTKAGYTQSFYCASELLSVEMGIPTMYSVYASGSNPNIMSGGGYIADWGPKKSSAGADGYNISIGVPFSLSTSVGTSSEYCKPVDLTNREKGLFKVQFDYIKWPSGNILHYCSPARRKVIFEKTYQACYCTWYDTDKAYTVYPYINYSISLSCSKISTDSHAKFSKQVCVNYNME